MTYSHTEADDKNSYNINWDADDNSFTCSLLSDGFV